MSGFPCRKSSSVIRLLELAAMGIWKDASDMSWPGMCSVWSRRPREGVVGGSSKEVEISAGK